MRASTTLSIATIPSRRKGDFGHGLRLRGARARHGTGFGEGGAFTRMLRLRRRGLPTGGSQLVARKLSEGASSGAVV